MRAALLACVGAVGQLLGALSSNALIASDVDATEQHLRPHAGETTIVLAFRSKCYSQRVARDLSVMLLVHYEEHHFGNLFAAHHWRTADIAFAPSSVRVPLFRPPPGSTLPHIRTALSTTLPPPGFNLSFTPGSLGQFASSVPSSSSYRPRPHRSATHRDSQMPQTPPPCPASNHSRRPSCCPLTRLLLSMPVCSPLAALQPPSSPSVDRVTDPDQRRPHPPPRIHSRTCSLSQPHPLCPNLPHELHLPSLCRRQVNRHVRMHLLPLPTRPPLRNGLLLPFPRPVRLRAALQRPARPRIPSHSVARSISRDKRRLTRRVDKSAGRRPHQIRLRLSNLKVLVRPRSSRKSRASLRLPCPRRPRRRQASPPSHPPRPSRQRRSRQSHVSRARVIAVRMTRARPLCLSRSRHP